MLLYIRHNRESLIRALRIMWTLPFHRAGSRHSSAHYFGRAWVYRRRAGRLYDGCLHRSAHGDHCLPENESEGSG